MSFQTPFTCELEYWKHLFLTQRFPYANQSQKEKCGCRFKWFYEFGKRKYLNNVWHNISLVSSDDTILQNTKITTSNVPGCVAGANKSQITYENIYHSSWIKSASLYHVLCTCTFLSLKLLFE